MPRSAGTPEKLLAIPVASTMKSSAEAGPVIWERLEARRRQLPARGKVFVAPNEPLAAPRNMAIVWSVRDRLRRALAACRIGRHEDVGSLPLQGGGQEGVGAAARHRARRPAWATIR